ncbi:MAG: O-antigen ligase domain-containing protein [Armatimonadetes bacterium]|nr:MAG: O-antigen ligase domain-containing protein [Armatimonadota bacterium]
MGHMSATVRVARFLEGLVEGKPGRQRLLTFFMVFTGLIVIAGGVAALLMKDPSRVLIGLGGLFFTVVVFTVMLTKHEWLLLLGLIMGHSIFYGNVPQLGMRIKGAAAPSDLMFFLAFVAGVVYWMGQKHRPKIPASITVAPIALFLYSAGYILIAFFLWNRQDNALIQAVGWLYFVLAIPTYLVLTTGRVWKSFFLVLLIPQFFGAVLSTMAEFRVGQQILSWTGYGGPAVRSFYDVTVKTNLLGMSIVVIFLGLVILGFAKKRSWQLLALGAVLSALAVVFFDRGRIHYAALFVCIPLLMIFFMPMRERLASMLRFVTAIIVLVLAIQGIGGKVKAGFDESVNKAYTRLTLINEQAIRADPGIDERLFHLRRAEAIWRQYPILGAGPGVRFGWEFQWDTLENLPITFIDNSWLYPLAVGGVVGMALILLCYAGFLYAIVTSYLQLRNPFHKALAAVPAIYMLWLFICSPVTWWLIDRYHVAAQAIMVAMALALVYHEKVNGSDVPVIDV